MSQTCYINGTLSSVLIVSDSIFTIDVRLIYKVCQVVQCQTVLFAPKACQYS